MTLHTWLPRPLFLALFAALAALFALPQVCFACSCLPPGPPLEALAEADAVFRGEIVAVERLSSPSGASYQRATVRVTRVWKGTPTTEIAVYTGGGGGDCGFAFQQGGDYLIYAYTVENPDGIHSWPVGSLATSICTRTSPSTSAADDLAALGPGQPPAPGLPNTGAGTNDAASERIIPGELLIGGAILAFLAVAQRRRVNGQAARG